MAARRPPATATATARRSWRPGGDRPSAPAAALHRPARAAAAAEAEAPASPGKQHRNAVLADLPEEQRPVAERALQGGIPAVRQAVNEQNARLKAEGKPEMPAAGRAVGWPRSCCPGCASPSGSTAPTPPSADLDELDLRDLRSVVAAATTRWSPATSPPASSPPS